MKTKTFENNSIFGRKNMRFSLFFEGQNPQKMTENHDLRPKIDLQIFVSPKTNQISPKTN